MKRQVSSVRWRGAESGRRFYRSVAEVIVPVLPVEAHLY